MNQQSQEGTVNSTARPEAADCAAELSSSTTPHLLVHNTGAIRVLTLYQPEKRNAFSLQMRRALRTQLERAQHDETCRAIILTGSQGYFSAGGDLTDSEKPATPEGRFADSNRVATLIATGNTPVVAAIEGGAFGVGLSLAAAADHVVAAQDAQFSCAFIKIGLSCDGGAAWSLPQRIGRPRARRMLMTGESISAVTAEEWGLVDQTCAPGAALAAALSYAKSLAIGPPLGFAALKSLLAMSEGSLSSVLAAEVEVQARLMQTEDAFEGKQAFFERRRPHFTGN